MNPFQSSCSASRLGLSLGNHYSLFLLTPTSTPHLAGERHSGCSGGVEVCQPLVKICSICISYSDPGPAASGVLGDWHHGTQTRLCSPEILLQPSTEPVMGCWNLVCTDVGGVLGCKGGGWKNSIASPHCALAFSEAPVSHSLTACLGHILNPTSLRAPSRENPT